MNAQVGVNVLLGSMVAVLMGIVWYQSSRVDHLESELARVDAAASHMPAYRRAMDSDTPRSEKDEDKKAVAEAPETVQEAEEKDWESTARRRAAKSAGIEPEALAEALEVNDPVVREKFRNMVREEQQILREERREERTKRWAKRQAEQLQEFKEKAGLSDEQHQSLTMYLDEERTQMSSIWSEARENMDFSGAREKSSNLRSETQQKAADVLDDDQYKAFEEMREEEMDRFRGRGGRGGRGGGGGR